MPLFKMQRMQRIHRLYECTVKDTGYVLGHGNPMCRLEDNDKMKENPFISKKEITENILS